MAIRKLDSKEFPDFKRSVVFELTTSSLTQGVFYLVVDPETEVANVYCLDEQGKPNLQDRSNLFLSTLANSKLAESGVLILHKRENIYQALRDWVRGESAIVLDELDWEYESLPYDSTLADVIYAPKTNIAAHYSGNPYSDVEPRVVDDGNDSQGGGGPTGGDSPLGDGPLPDEGGGDGAPDAPADKSPEEKL